MLARHASKGNLTTLGLILGLMLACTACGGRSADMRSAEEPSGQRIVSERVVLTVLEETYIAGGRAAAIEVSERQGQGEVLVDVSVRGAEKLKALFFHLEYDPARFGAGRLDNSWLLGPEKDCLALYLTDPASGTIEFGEMLMLPHEARADGSAKGFTGDGLVCTLHLKTGASTVQRKPSVAPGSDGARASLSYDAVTQTLSWQHFSPGDYNQDGLVAVSDLTPIGIHFNQDVPAGSDPDDRDSTSIEDVVDGSNDGKVNVADLTAIGLNFQSRTSGYNVYKGSPSDLPASNRAENGAGAELVESVAFEQRQGNPGSERVGFERPLAAPDPAKVYWVRPMDDTAPGTPSSTISPASGNRAPVAYLFANHTEGTAAPYAVTFYAYLSVDNDGSISSWEFDAEGDGTFDIAVSEEPWDFQHTYDQSGVYDATLRVTDNEGASSTATVSIAVSEAGNAAPTAVLKGDNLSGDVPLTVFADSTESFDSDGTIVKREWSVDGGKTWFLDDGSGILEPTFEHGGSASVLVRVTDEKYARSTAALNLSLSAPDNLQPIAHVQADLTSGPAPLTVNFDASSSVDTDGSIVSYYWDFNGDTIIDDTTSVPAAQFLYNQHESFTVRLQVQDDDGELSGFDTVVINVNSGWEIEVIEDLGLDLVQDTALASITQQDLTERPLLAYRTTAQASILARLGSTGVGPFGAASTIVTDMYSGSIDLGEFNGMPGLIYGRDGAPGTAGLAFVRANMEDGSSWGLPQTIISTFREVASGGLELASIGGLPAVACVGEAANEGPTCSFVRANNAAGDTWSASVELDHLNSDVTCLGISLCETAGRGRAIYNDINGPGLFMCRANDAEATSWSAASSISDVASIRPAAAAAVDSKVAVFYNFDGGIYLQLSTDENANSWQTVRELVPPAHGVASEELDFAYIGGLPSLAWRGKQNKLHFMQSSDAAASSFNAPEIVDVTSYSGGELSLADFEGRPMISYSRGVGGHNELCVAWKP